MKPRWRDAAALCSPLLGLLLLCLLPLGCGSISLREAMDRVQKQYVRLNHELEAGSSFGARDAARGLREALEARAVARESPYAGDAEFQRLLGEAVAATEEVEQVARKFDTAALAGLRSGVSARCDACHARFRSGG